MQIHADRIVNGVREPMGTLTLDYDAATGSWSAEIRTRYHARWTFEPRGDVMEGTLRDLSSNRLVRRISVQRMIPTPQRQPADSSPLPQPR